MAIYKKRSAAKKIQRAFRRKRFARKKAIVRKPLYPENTNYLKSRVNFSIKAGDLTLNPDGSAYFNIYQCPWQNVSTTTNNLVYSRDFENMIGNSAASVIPLYQRYKLNCIVYEIRRPQLATTPTGSIGNQTSFHPNQNMWGTQVLHSKVVYAPDAVTGVVQPTQLLSPKVELNFPSNWNESVDNLSKMFHVHGYKSYEKRIWKPLTPYEKRWRDYSFGDRELACGGLHLRSKSMFIGPDLTGVIPNDQVIWDVTATIYMSFNKRL